MNDWGISEWHAEWASAQSQFELHSSDLRALLGRRLSNAWIVWNLELDEWFADLPVVLEFDDHHQLEVCWQKFDDLAISWNTINVAVDPAAWGTWPLTWRARGHPALANVVGETVTSVASTEHLFTMYPVDPGNGATGARSTWLTSGLWLETAATGLHIFNALDENGLTNDTSAPGAEVRRNPI